MNPAERPLTVPSSSRRDLSDLVVGDWLVQPTLGRISRGDTVLRLRPQLMDLLLCLASRPGETLSKEEILDIVWPGQFIVDTGLSRCVAELRAALGDSPQEVKFVETIPKRGYRLVAPVSKPAAPESAPPRPTVATAPPMPAEETPGGSVEPAASTATVATVETPVHRAHVGVPAFFLSTRLRRALALASVLVLGALGFAGWRLLHPQPVLGNGPVVVVVENGTGQSVFDATPPMALAMQMEQSPLLRVVSEERVREELRYMNHPAGERLTRAVARDVCRRVGAVAVLAGQVTKIGPHYVIGIEGTNCESGEVLARHQLEVTDEQSVVDGMGRAASMIRRRLGESVTSIRKNDVPVVQATTASLEALQQFSLAERARGRGDDGEALRLYRRAVELDPQFALAHARLGVQLLAVYRQGEAVAVLEQASRLRDRASPAERQSIAAYHAGWVERDPVAALSPLEAWRDARPESAVARLSLAHMDSQVGRLDQALAEAREAVRIDPDSALAAAVLAEVLFRAGHVDEARAAGDQLVARGRDNVLVRGVLADIAFVSGNVDGLRRHLE